MGIRIVDPDKKLFEQREGALERVFFLPAKARVFNHLANEAIFALTYSATRRTGFDSLAIRSAMTPIAFGFTARLISARVAKDSPK